MKNKLAIIDYGIGGFDLFKMIKRDFPNYPLFYFSDSGYIPYGKLKKDKLKNRIFSVFNFLKSKDITQVAVACHAASTVSQGYEGLEIINMIDSTIDSINNHNFSSIGIIGGGRTIHSKVYKNAVKDSTREVFQRNAQQLSIIIEDGSYDKLTLEKTLKQVLNPIQNVDVLLLACTHYPAIKKEISMLMKQNCTLIDPMEDVYIKLKINVLNSNYSEKDQIYTSGNISTMKIACQNAFDVNLNNIIPVKIN